MRIMLDTNAIDKMYNDLDIIVACNKYRYFITSVQVEEIKQIPSYMKEKKIQDFLAMSTIQPVSLPVPAVVGVAKVGDCVPSDDSIYLDLLKETHSNIKDAMIGAAAKREACAVITDDVDFSKRLNKYGVHTMTYNEFRDSLYSP